MKTITLTRRTVKDNPTLPTSYLLEIEVISAQDITKDVFVKQRLRNIDNTHTDVFAAICTPALLEELEVDNPSAGTSYFRTSKIQLVGANESYLDELFNTILGEVQVLVQNAEVFDTLKEQATYSVTSSAITKTTP